MRRRALIGGLVGGLVAAVGARPTHARQPDPETREIPRRTFGKTGVELSVIGLAGGRFPLITFDEAVALTRRAVELGINYFDTAPAYADSEEVLGRILRDVRAPLIISTKLGGRPQPFNPRDESQLVRSVEDSLKLLGRDVIDVLFIHEPDRPGQYPWWTDAEDVVGPVLNVLDQLKQRDLIRFTGLGGTTAYEMAHFARSGRFDVVLSRTGKARHLSRYNLPSCIDERKLQPGHIF